MIVYDRTDPDSCAQLVHLTVDDARTLAETLGASQVTEAVTFVQQQIEGLLIGWEPIVAGVIIGGSAVTTVSTVTIAMVATAITLVLALRYGGRFSQALAQGANEVLILGIFGITLLVAGPAERIEVSGAIGAFLVGLAGVGPRAGSVPARCSSRGASSRS